MRHQLLDPNTSLTGSIGNPGVYTAILVPGTGPAVRRNLPELYHLSIGCAHMRDFRVVIIFGSSLHCCRNGARMQFAEINTAHDNDFRGYPFQLRSPCVMDVAHPRIIRLNCGKISYTCELAHFSVTDPFKWKITGPHRDSVSTIATLQQSQARGHAAGAAHRQNPTPSCSRYPPGCYAFSPYQ